MTSYEKKTNKELRGKAIKKAEVTGSSVWLKFTDGTMFKYSASDGGYSCWKICKSE